MLPALAILFVSAAGQPAPAAPPARYAIVVGHNGGQGEEKPLQFADDDAARLFKLLLPSTEQSWLLTTFDAASVNLYPTLSQVARSPSKTALAQVLGEVNWAIGEKKAAGRATELFIFFAGHGDVDFSGRGFLRLADGPFTRDDLEQQVLLGSRADINHIVIDACASYFMVGRGPASSKGVKLSPEMLDTIKRPGADVEEAQARTGVLVSTSDASEVHESTALRGGLFSHLLRSALSGAADINDDGRVEYGEVAAFVASASRTAADPRARLAVHVRAPAQQPHFPIADLRSSGAANFLVVDNVRAHIKVLDEDGGPYAELFPNGGHVVLALNGSRLYVIQAGDDEAILVPRRAGAYALSALTFGPRANTRSAMTGPFRGVWAHAFTKEFADGYLTSNAFAEPAPGDRFSPPWAAGYEPAIEVPWAWLGGLGMFTAAASLFVAFAAVLGNALTFAALESKYRQTGIIDRDLAVGVEVFRIVAALGALSALSAASTGGVLLLISFQGGAE